MATADKAPGAFRTIGELSQELGVAQHILRYWETKFPQLKPLQRAGNRRYYRPADVDLARKISALAQQDGYTVRGVPKCCAIAMAQNPTRHRCFRLNQRRRRATPAAQAESRIDFWFAWSPARSAASALDS